jgi:hypothetical protein
MITWPSLGSCSSSFSGPIPPPSMVLLAVALSAPFHSAFGAAASIEPVGPPGIARDPGVSSSAVPGQTSSECSWYLKTDAEESEGPTPAYSVQAGYQPPQKVNGEPIGAKILDEQGEELATILGVWVQEVDVYWRIQPHCEIPDEVLLSYRYYEASVIAVDPAQSPKDILDKFGTGTINPAQAPRGEMSMHGVARFYPMPPDAFTSSDPPSCAESLYDAIGAQSDAPTASGWYLAEGEHGNPVVDENADLVLPPSGGHSAGSFPVSVQPPPEWLAPCADVCEFERCLNYAWDVCQLQNQDGSSAPSSGGDGGFGLSRSQCEEGGAE